MALLVAFHWEHALISALVAVPRDGSFEGGMEALKPVFKDVVEPNQQREIQVAVLQALHQLHKIETAATFSTRLHAHMTAQVDREVGVAPTFQAVKLGTFLHIPIWTG